MQFRFQEQLLHSQLEIQEQTLKNISQEIHDNIGQTLSLVKLNLNTIDLHKGEGSEEKILYSKELVSKAIVDLRNISRSLNTDAILSGGLIKAIETELNIINNAGSLKGDLIITGHKSRLDPRNELILFRIVQEAINNIIKHSGASLITVRIIFTEGQLAIKISDNGSGFDSNLAASDGSGLRNMRNRAELIGGSFEIYSGPGGTTISVNLPIIQS